MTAKLTAVKMRDMNETNAFSLVELLVVVAIIGVLSALIFTSLKSSRNGMDRAVAVSQMRQIGLAILAYANENNDTVPGPVSAGPGVEYNPGKTTELATRLGPYLGVEDLSRTQMLQVFLPPACVRAMPGVSPDTLHPFVVNISMVVNGKATTPWGSTSDSSKLPLKLGAVSSTTWAFVDADRQNPQVIGQPWEQSTPPQPVHGRQRLAWFFDGSVQGVETSALVSKSAPPPPPTPPPKPSPHSQAGSP